MRAGYFIVAALLLLGGRYLAQAQRYAPEEGDIVFQALPDSNLHALISGSTHSPFSHCGVVTRLGGEFMVLESRGPVREIRLEDWIANGGEAGFAAYRLRPGLRGEIPKFIAAARTFLGLPYDYRYRFSGEAVYCSELVFKAFRAATGHSLGRLCKLRDLDWQPYQEIIQQLERGPVPLDRLLIVPCDLAQARQLQEVHRERI